MTRDRTCSSGNDVDCDGTNLDIKFCDPQKCQDQWCADISPAVCQISDPAIQALICHDPVIAATKCPRTCGYCGCKDVFNCTSTNSTRHYFCSDSSLAARFCRRTCGKCDEKAANITFNSCQDIVDDEQCILLDKELCICQDYHIRPMCAHYCDGQCDYKPTHIPSCDTSATQTVVGKRSRAL